MPTDEADVVVVGSGGAGLVAACAAAEAGLDVVVLERSDVFGGTTAISGGMLWIGNNGRSQELGVPDSREETLTYLDRITRGTTRALLEPLVDSGPELVRYLEDATPVDLFPIGRPDYHAHFAGGKIGGRVLDNQPFDPARFDGVGALLRRGTHFPPLTYAERHAWRWPGQVDQALVAQRSAAGITTLGGALAGGLLAAALERGVQLVSGLRAYEIGTKRGRATAVRCLDGDRSPRNWRAGRAVVLSNGGFEWNASMRRSFLRGPAVTAVSPPWNVGDGLRMAMRVGAAVDNMSEGWWGPTYRIPGETYDGAPMTRHIVNELSLPGSILVNRSGRRFVNESTNYNDLSKAFHVFEPSAYDFVNTPAWLVFDGRYQSSYAALTVPAGDPPPAWFSASGSLAELAARTGIDAAGLAATVADFNRHAAGGEDPAFSRGERALDRYYGDDRHHPSPCLAPVVTPPFFAVEVLPGLLGTKGGARTDADGRVLDYGDRPIDGLYACGNAAASVLGPGYPGAGGSLGPQLVFGLRCGRAIARG